MLTKEITSLQHPFIKHVVKLRTDRKYRHAEQTVLITGRKMIEELAPVKILMTEKGCTSLPSAKEYFFMPPSLLKKITGLDQPEAIAALVELPKPATLQKKQYILALDQIADPGNLGTLLRTALALGWEGVFLLDGCADPFNDKALRAAKGATFRLDLCFGSWEDLTQQIQDNGINVLVADLQGTALSGIVANPPLLLILGNESQGPSLFAKKHFPRVCIPMAKTMESLNVAAAGAILMHQLRGL